MTWIRTVDEEDAGVELKRLYARAADPETGGVDHILKVHGLHPDGLRAHLALYEASMQGTPGLPRVDREMLALTVSLLNGCRY